MTRRELTYRQMPVPVDISALALEGAKETYAQAVNKPATYVYLGTEAFELWVRAGAESLGLTPVIIGTPQFRPREWAVGDEDGPVYGSGGTK